MDTELFQEWFQAFAQNAGHHAARREPLRRQQPPYRRDLLQGPGARAAQAIAIDPRQAGRGALDQGRAGRVALAARVTAAAKAAASTKKPDLNWNDRRDHRLWIGQPAFGGQGVRARRRRSCGRKRPILVTSDPDAVAKADRIVLPGVGAFADCRRGLDRLAGMMAALDRRGRGPGQALPRHLRRHAAHGRSAGSSTAAIPASAGSPARCARSRRPTPRSRCRTWAGTRCASRLSHPVLAGSPTARHVYFVHSYHLAAGERGRRGGDRRTMAARSPPWSAATT